MKIKIKEAMELYEVIDRLCQRNDIDFRLSYALGKNQSRMRDIKSGLEKAMKSPDAKAHAEFEEARMALATKHAKRGPDKKPFILPNSQGQQEYQIEDLGAFNEELKLLKAKYSSLMDSLDKQKIELEDLLEREEEIEFYEVPLSAFPKNMNIPMRPFIPIIKNPDGDLFSEPPQGGKA